MTLRPILMSDADFMLQLKNYPETRQFAIASHDEIKKEDHYKWLEKNLQYFQVIENVGEAANGHYHIRDKEAIGAIRIQDNEISIWIDRRCWGEGIASYIIEEISSTGMTCKIVNGNIGSFRAFVNAGFRPISYQDNYYILQK